MGREFYNGLQRGRLDDIAAAIIFIAFFSLIGFIVGSCQK
jgi:hypothetical protein